MHKTCAVSIRCCAWCCRAHGTSAVLLAWQPVSVRAGSIRVLILLYTCACRGHTLLGGSLQRQHAADIAESRPPLSRRLSAFLAALLVLYLLFYCFTSCLADIAEARPPLSRRLSALLYCFTCCFALLLYCFTCCLADIAEAR